MEKLIKQLNINDTEKINTLIVNGFLSSGIIHDLLNYFNILSLRLECSLMEESISLQEMKKISQDLLSDLKVIREISQSGREILSGPGKIKQFSIREEIKKAVEMTSFLQKKHQVKLSLEEFPDLYIQGSSICFYRVILNLLCNSIEALSLSKKPNKEIKLSASVVSDFLEIELEDNGPGIKKEDKKQIFAFNFSSKEKGNMGIGLAICWDILNNYFNAKIILKKSNLDGSIFLIKLPYIH